MSHFSKYRMDFSNFLPCLGPNYKQHLFYLFRAGYWTLQFRSTHPSARWLCRRRPVHAADAFLQPYPPALRHGCPPRGRPLQCSFTTKFNNQSSDRLGAFYATVVLSLLYALFDTSRYRKNWRRTKSARIIKHLWITGIDSKEWIPSAYGDNPITIRFLAPIDCLKIPGENRWIYKMGFRSIPFLLPCRSTKGNLFAATSVCRRNHIQSRLCI